MTVVFISVFVFRWARIEVIINCRASNITSLSLVHSLCNIKVKIRFKTIGLKNECFI